MEEAENRDLLNPGCGKPEITDRLHWNISSNVLCNYMKEQEYLDMILQNRAIIPRYVIEPIEYLGLGNYKKICFPMTCFCDIPFSKVSSHMSRYGGYGIGLDKETVLNKYRIQPIQYINNKSPLADDFKQAFLTYLESEREIDGLHKVLSDYLISALVYMKPVWGYETDNNGNLKNYIYQDECEWRYIPSDRFPRNLDLILPQEMTNNYAKEIFSKVLQNHKECWLQFGWQDVRYILVPDEEAARKTIGKINSLPILDEEKYELMTKIEISSRFADNL